MGLGGQKNIPVPRGWGQRARAPGRRGQQRRDLASADRRRVVLEADHRVARVLLQGLLDELHQSSGGGPAVQDELRAEEPVARVLRVGLRQVEELDVGRVAPQLVREEVEVEVDVLFVEGEPELGVDRGEGGLALGEERDGADRLGGGRNNDSGRSGRRRV